MSRFNAHQLNITAVQARIQSWLVLGSPGVCGGLHNHNFLGRLVQTVLTLPMRKNILIHQLKSPILYLHLLEVSLQLTESRDFSVLPQCICFFRGKLHSILECDGLTLAGQQVPVKAGLSLPFLSWTGEKIYNKTHESR